MKEIGEILRNAREEKGMTYEEISEITKIQPRYLQALEEGDTSLFPGEVYVKGSIRIYAKILGLDEAELMNWYNQQKAETPEPVEIKREEKAKPLYTGADSIWKNLIVGILVILLLFGGIKLYQEYFADYNEGIPVDSADPGNDGPAEEDENDESFLPSEDDEEIEEVKEPELLLVESSGEVVVYELLNQEEINIEISFNGRCWVSLVVDEEEIVRGNYESGQNISETAENELRLRLGNPPAAQVTAGGLEVATEDFRTPATITIRIPQSDDVSEE